MKSATKNNEKERLLMDEKPEPQVHNKGNGAGAYGSNQLQNKFTDSKDLQSVPITPRSSNSISSSDTDRITLTWSNVNCRVNLKQRNWCGLRKTQKYTATTKHILKDVFGVAQPGQLMAIMGSSGAGKTTLLNILTRRNLGSLQVAGNIRMNGQIVDDRTMRLMSAYVQQDDLFIGELTVKEHLHFHAFLRMGRSVTKEQRHKRVNDLLRDLNLVKCENTQIGNPLFKRGISGGERKRLAFATELLTNPSIMFCDEPTSGLDSFMAQNVVSVLKKEAAAGKTIVCTIHQPSSQVFTMFDVVYLMAEGRVAYAGPVEHAMEYFQTVGYPSPGNFNPADHYIRTLAVVPRREKECRNRIKEICAFYVKTELGQDLMKRSASIDYQDSTDMDGQANGTLLKHKPISVVRYKASWFDQIIALLWRSVVGVVRNPLLLRVRFFQSVMVALLTGLIYLGSPRSGAAYVQNVNGVLFQIVTNMSFGFLFGVVDTFTKEIPIFMRDYASGVYRVDTYYIAKQLAEFPIYTILPAIFTTILYWMAGLTADVGTYFTCVGIALLCCNTGISIGYAVSAATANINLALAITPALIIPLMLFGGFLLNAASVPVYLRWLQYFSYFKYSYEALTINQWAHVESIPGCLNSTCADSGHKVLEQLSFNENNLGLDLIIMTAMIFIIRFIGYAALQLRVLLKN